LLGRLGQRRWRRLPHPALALLGRGAARGGGARLVLATPSDSRTVRDLQRAGRARVALAPTRDVVLIDASVEVFAPDAVDPAVADAFAARHNWEPRDEPGPYSYLILTPQRVQSWREANELAGRTIMRDGVWLA
jgi:hypothetical protein